MIISRRYYVLGITSFTRVRFYSNNCRPINQIAKSYYTTDINKAVKFHKKSAAIKALDRMENEVDREKLEIIHVPGIVRVKHNPPRKHRGAYDFVSYSAPLAQLD